MKISYLTLLTLLISAIATQAADKPNFLIILADDLGYRDVGFTGSKEIRTPNLDRLANNGLIFENGYVTHPYCGPSRAGLITGRYQARFGMEINVTHSPYDIHSGLPLEEKTFADRLKPAGYRTGIIGKWHLGAAYPFHPNNRGFDHFYGFLSGGHSYFPENTTTIRPLLKNDGTPHYSANEGGYLPLMRNNQAGEFTEYLTTALSREAAAFVSESDEPFCLYLAYNAPHGPMEAPKETFDKYGHIADWTRRTYAAMIDEMDQGIGMVVEALRESGKLDNTLIFFLSDNGGVTPKPGHENETWANNGPFRRGKGSLLEGGSHVPFILHWPNGIKEPGRFTGLVSSLDLAATAVALGGGDTSGEPLDGVNLAPYISGEKDGSPHKALYWRITDGISWAVRTESAKYLKENWGSTETELYDMVNDPYESTNIVKESPEIRKELAKLWNEWNSANKGNVLLQSGDYQKQRLKMYDDLFKKLQKKADKKRPKVIN
jgi:arylsulfatase A-like enzyme